jgi:hypothetical protein
MGYNPCGSNQAMLAHMESLDHGLEPLWVKPGYACSYGVLRLWVITHVGQTRLCLLIWSP